MDRAKCAWIDRWCGATGAPIPYHAHLCPFSPLLSYLAVVSHARALSRDFKKTLTIRERCGLVWGRKWDNDSFFFLSFLSLSLSLSLSVRSLPLNHHHHYYYYISLFHFHFSPSFSHPLLYFSQPPFYSLVLCRREGAHRPRAWCRRAVGPARYHPVALGCAAPVPSMR